jgi:hypothetical protein
MEEHNWISFMSIFSAVSYSTGERCFALSTSDVQISHSSRTSKQESTRRTSPATDAASNCKAKLRQFLYLRILRHSSSVGCICFFMTFQSSESIDAAIGDVLSKPWLPLPLGLKPPSVDSVMDELQRQGVSTRCTASLWMIC